MEAKDYYTRFCVWDVSLVEEQLVMWRITTNKHDTKFRVIKCIFIDIDLCNSVETSSMEVENELTFVAFHDWQLFLFFFSQNFVQTDCILLSSCLLRLVLFINLTYSQSESMYDYTDE